MFLCRNIQGSLEFYVKLGYIITRLKQCKHSKIIKANLLLKIRKLPVQIWSWALFLGESSVDKDAGQICPRTEFHNWNTAVQNTGTTNSKYYMWTWTLFSLCMQYGGIPGVLEISNFLIIKHLV